MSRLPLVRLPPNAVIHRFGTPSTAPASSALLRFGQPGWTIGRSRPEGWAIVGDGEGRRLAVETLLSRHRIHPVTPPPGPFPYINSLLEQASSNPSSTSGEARPRINKSNTEILDTTSKPIRHLAFARPPPSGEFTDFTARYGSLQDEDRLSFRETLSSLHPPPSTIDIERVADLMKIGHLLDLPSVSLSSGQTRRARIASGLLSKPVLLILEDPMAGLDVKSRDEVAKVLGGLNEKGDIRIVLVLRGKGGDMPDWVTNVCQVRNGDVWVGSRAEWEGKGGMAELIHGKIEDVEEVPKAGDTEKEVNANVESEPVVQLSNVNVSYGEGTRKVLQDVSWTIRPGDKWHLQGANGSGKTTLLSLILGHHPRSFSLPSESLTLFSKPRRSIPTPTLRSLIGHTSPEIYASFPRGMGLTALGTIGSGYEGVFSRRYLNDPQTTRVMYLLSFFQDLLSPNRGLWKVSERNSGDEDELKKFASTPFSHFPPTQQALLLFLRAVVSRPKLLILDEPSQGMDEVIWERCRNLLEKEWVEIVNEDGEGNGQAVIVVSHYEDEVPWNKGLGKVYKLDTGRGKAV